MKSGWRTSSYTEPNDTCVMVKYLIAEPDTVDLGDTKDADGKKIHFSAVAWSKFIGSVIAE